MAACVGRDRGNSRASSGDDDDATGDDDDATGDDDDATGDDDDATGDDDDATGDDDDASVDAQGSLPCDEEVVDIWTFSTGSGNTVQITVDTVSAASTFDPGSYAVDGPNPNTDTLLGTGDDELDCAFPPPSYACPQFTFEAPGSGLIAIVVENYGCEDESSTAQYILSVQSTGSLSSLVLASDDEALGSGARE